MEGKRSNCIALAAALAALGALLLCSQAALESARAGLSLCAQMIVPSLLQQRRHDHLCAEAQPRACALERRLRA